MGIITGSTWLIGGEEGGPASQGREGAAASLTHGRETLVLAPYFPGGPVSGALQCWLYGVEF